jgi:hypothetical protein
MQNLMTTPDLFHLDRSVLPRFSRRSAIYTAGASGLAAMTGLASMGRLQAAQQNDGTPAATPGTGTPASSPPAGTPPAAADYRTVPTVFENEAFNFELLIALGASFERVADIGECFATASRITDGDFDSWFTEWTRTGDRLQAIAETSDGNGHRVSAREAYLRASTYYSMATFFALGTSGPNQFESTWETHRFCFETFLARLDIPAEPVTIPYEDTTLPGFALTVDDSGQQRPWIILNNGSDGTGNEMWSMGAAAALRRGYNALIFDGPGQNAALFRQKLHFRPDWEKVITPVVDYLLTRDDVDPNRIAISGVSQAGYWVPRAVAFEHRIAAAVADPGVVDVSTSWTSSFPAEMLQEFYSAEGAALEEFKTGIDQAATAEMEKSPEIAYTLRFRMYPYGTSSLAETLLLLRDYNLHGVIDQIQCPMLVTDPEGETFWPGQSVELYDALTSPKKLVTFTAEEGADLHCEPKAMGLRSQVIFDWLDDILGHSA